MACELEYEIVEFLDPPSPRLAIKVKTREKPQEYVLYRLLSDELARRLQRLDSLEKELKASHEREVTLLKLLRG